MRSRQQTIAIILSKFKKRFGGARFQSSTDMTYRSGAADNAKLSTFQREMRELPEGGKTGTSAGGRTGWLIPQADGSVVEHSADPSVKLRSHADLLLTAPEADRIPLGLVGTNGNYPKALKAGWVRFSHGDRLFMANFHAKSSQMVIDHIRKHWAGQPIVLEMEALGDSALTVSGKFDDDKKAIRWINEQLSAPSPDSYEAERDARRAQNQNNVDVQLDIAKGLAREADAHARVRALKAKLKKPRAKRIKKSMVMNF